MPALPSSLGRGDRGEGGGGVVDLDAAKLCIGAPHPRPLSAEGEGRLRCIPSPANVFARRVMPAFPSSLRRRDRGEGGGGVVDLDAAKLCIGAPHPRPRSAEGEGRLCCIPSPANVFARRVMPAFPSPFRRGDRGEGGGGVVDLDAAKLCIGAPHPRPLSSVGEGRWVTPGVFGLSLPRRRRRDPGCGPRLCGCGWIGGG